MRFYENPPAGVMPAGFFIGAAAAFKCFKSIAPYIEKEPLRFSA